MANGRSRRHRSPAPARTRKRAHQTGVVDFKDVALLRTFISDRGKIRSHSVTGLARREHRAVAVAIKNAREMALLPYPGTSPTERRTNAK
jgi:small subunit ribosomal protein S18